MIDAIKQIWRDALDAFDRLLAVTIPAYVYRDWHDADTVAARTRMPAISPPAGGLTASASTVSRPAPDVDGDSPSGAGHPSARPQVLMDDIMRDKIAAHAEKFAHLPIIKLPITMTSDDGDIAELRRLRDRFYERIETAPLETLVAAHTRATQAYTAGVGTGHRDSGWPSDDAAGQLAQWRAELDGTADTP